MLAAMKIVDVPAIAPHRFAPNGGTGALIVPAACGGALLAAAPDHTFITEGEGPVYCFQIVSGCVRAVRLLEDGRRQVGAFLFPGDVFGWDASGPQDCAVESVTPVTVRRFRLAAVEECAAHDRGFARCWRDYIIAQARLGRERLMLLGRRTAAERVAAFLLEMHARLNAAEPAPLGAMGGATLHLPMSRADVSDYLGLTTETVSRVLSGLRRRGVIAAAGPRIVIRDPRALAPTAPSWLQ